MTSMEMTPRDATIFGTILVLAAVLRFYKLDAPLWHDEIYTVLLYIRSSFGQIVSEFGFNNHVFYSLQSKLSVVLFGETNWALRLPAVLFGVGGIAAMWWLARMVTSTLQAHVIAALLALSYHHVWFSQNARGYTEIAFWCTLATIFFIAGLRDPKWRTWIAYGVCIAAAMYTHLTAAFSVVAHGLTYLAMLSLRFAPWRVSTLWKASASLKDNIPIFGGFALGGLLVLALYVPALFQVIDNVFAVSGTSEVDVMQEYQNPFWTVFEALRTVARNGVLAALVGIGVLLTLVVGTISIGRKEPILPVVVWVHILVTFLVLTTLSMRVWPRFFFVDIGPLFLLITQGVFVVCQHTSERLRNWLSVELKPQLLTSIAIVAMILLSVVILARNYQYPKQNLEGAYAFVESERQSGDAVVTLGQTVVPFADYFEADWSVIESRQGLTEIEAQSKTVWLVTAFPARTFRKHDDIMSDVDARYTLERRFVGTLGDGNVLVYRHKSP